MKPLLPPPLQGLIAAIAIWLLAKHSHCCSPELAFSKVMGGLLIALGLSIDLICTFNFFRAKTTINPLKPDNTSSLVTTGLYRYSRNPMYLGLLIILLGWTLIQGNVLGLIIVALFVTSITQIQIKPEEIALEKKFGEEFKRYKTAVRRWI